MKIYMEVNDEKKNVDANMRLKPLKYWCLQIIIKYSYDFDFR